MSWRQLKNTILAVLVPVSKRVFLIPIEQQKASPTVRVEFVEVFPLLLWKHLTKPTLPASRSDSYCRTKSAIF